MLLNIFIILTILTVFCFAVSYIIKNPLLWVITLVLSGTMAVSSFDIQIQEYQFQAATLSYSPVLQSYSYPMISTLFMIVIGLSLLYFYSDLMDIIKNKESIEELEGQRK